MELWEDGLNVIIQMPNLRREERRAFKKSFKRYYYLETTGEVPVAVWIFDFPKPHGAIDPAFDAQRVKPEYVESFLNTDGGIKNLIQFFLLDGNTLAAIKAIGISPDAMQLFHNTIRKQLAMDYNRVDYDSALAVAFMDDTYQLMKRGKPFSFLTDIRTA